MMTRSMGLVRERLYQRSIQIQETTSLIRNTLCLLLILQHQLQGDLPEIQRDEEYVLSTQLITTTHKLEWLQITAYLRDLMVSGSLALDKDQMTTSLLVIFKLYLYDFHAV